MIMAIQSICVYLKFISITVSKYVQHITVYVYISSSFPSLRGINIYSIIMTSRNGLMTVTGLVRVEDDSRSSLARTESLCRPILARRRRL